MVVNLRAPGSLESLTKVVATQTFFENPETLCVGDPIWRIFLELGWNHQLVDFRPQSHSLMWDASRLFSMPGTGDATAWTMFFFVMIHLLHLFICLFIHGWLFLLIWWFVYLFTLLYCVELKQDPIIYVVEFRWLLSGCSSLNFRRNRRPFMCGKKRKIYAMFIYDLFHTVLELPFLGLYPMVFCAYVLASMMILKKPLHNARRQMNNMCAAKAINENKSILSSSHAKVISYSSQLLLLLGEALCHFIFAVMWWCISDSCAIGLGSLLSAFYFSVETQMTIGCLDLR